MIINSNISGSSVNPVNPVKNYIRVYWYSFMVLL